MCDLAVLGLHRVLKNKINCTEPSFMIYIFFLCPTLAASEGRVNGGEDFFQKVSVSCALGWRVLCLSVVFKPSELGAGGRCSSGRS